MTQPSVRNLEALSAFTGATVGNWTNSEARTGCTVIAFDGPKRCVADVRGGGPGTRETDLLAVGRLVQRANAILLTGGSAFGLGAADGVMRGLREDGLGFPTTAGPVPIVPAAVLFDLSIGEAVWPDAQAGYDAYQQRQPLANMARGQVGAGTGATFGKVLGRDAAQQGGLGLGVASWAGGHVAAIAAVNANGVVRGRNHTSESEDFREAILQSTFQMSQSDSSPIGEPETRENTTLVAVIVAAPADQNALHRVCVAAHDAMARVIVPCHTPFDGDVVFAAALEDGETTPLEMMPMILATELAVERAIQDAVSV